MPDNLEHVQPGSPFAPSAATWNEFIDAARAVKANNLDAGRGPLDALFESSLKCLVKYDASSASTLSAFSVLGYSTPLISPATDAGSRLLANRRPVFTGAVPTSAAKPFVITCEPIQGTALGRAITHGVAVVQVSIGSTSHARARPVVGTTSKLESCSSGGVPILWKESGTGTKWAMVLLDFGDDSRSADCSDMLGLVRADKCLRMTITEVQGSCSDIDTTQTADLTYDAAEEALISADLLYGCPPGVTTTICSTGAPNKFNIVVAGFGAPNTNLNQSYTVTHTTGEIWTATKGGVTVTATRISGGWTLSLDDGTVTVTYDTTGMDVCCSTVTFDLLADDGTTTAPATLSMTIATACGDGPSYTPRLERVSGDCGLCLKFTWVPTAGSGSRVIPWKQVGCGEDADGQPYIEFATDDPVICTGTDGAACTGNKVVVRLTCQSCGGPTTVQLDCCVGSLSLPYQLCVQIAAGTCDYSFTAKVPFRGVFNLGGGGDVALWTSQPYPPTESPTITDVVVQLGCVDGDLIWAVGWGDQGVSNCGAGGSSGPADCSAILPQEIEIAPGPVGVDCVCQTGETMTATITDASGGCDAPSWNCIPGVGCVEVFDGSGEYASEAECTASCGGAGTPPSPGGPGCLSCGLLGETPTLVIPDGTYAGTYVADGPWAAGAYPGQTTFTIGGSTVAVYCNLGGTAYLGVHPDFGGGAIGGSSSCGPPVVMTFSGTGVGAVGNATVTT